MNIVGGVGMVGISLMPWKMHCRSQVNLRYRKVQAGPADCTTTRDCRYVGRCIPGVTYGISSYNMTPNQRGYQMMRFAEEIVLEVISRT